MATIFVTFEVPDNAKEYFITKGFDPFEKLALTVKVDRDNVTTMLQDVVGEAKFQLLRDAQDQKEIGSL